ncbi:hypothetical protein [Pontibacter fetidus]|uniref:VLRF1 domain-containing protein n=1 Tax=Pontibacter fetidus TaxID=2700082 RepID=A0A6B2H9J1_9BACT|nr:hypothetical protein [Pontibacter fetidus]NDK57407.1 hypothetical protein [Pontibacter fetidus]
MNRLLPTAKAADLLRIIQAKSIPTTYDPEKHRLALLDAAGNEQLYFRLPITVLAPAASSNDSSLQVNYVILLIQSGNCALGYFENGRNLDHKVYRSYMVRKKQGKSQIKYLKTKGKSRAGSRVRLGETVEFFENINGRLQDYFEDHEVHRIAISCSKTLIPYLFGSKVATPFDKHDPRLFKIPKHIHTPIYEVLLDANRFLQRGELIYDETQQAIVNELTAELGDFLPDDDETESNYSEEEFDEEPDVYLQDEEDEMEW